MSEQYSYPFTLDRATIEALLPHRGDIFACDRLVIEGIHNFTGYALWMSENQIIKGHFPGLPIVPGVLLIEALAQLAGAGLLAGGDPYLKGLTGDWIGVLAAVRNCRFTRPVLPDGEVEFVIQCRQMATLATQVKAAVSADGVSVGQLEIVLAYASRAQISAALEPTSAA
ncbi:MAG TPA: hypothetical protein VGK97_03725 [Spongiibacteraceae bacterium]|jgi:3-hydroxyacyl-[acyl-carrier-protein] dehydratase